MKLLISIVFSTLLLTSSLYAQSIVTFPSPAGYDRSYGGLWGSPIEFNGKVYITYNAFSTNFGLAEFDGNAVVMLPEPSGLTNMEYRGYYPIKYNNQLYLNYKRSLKGYLVKFDGISLTIIPNPPGYSATNLLTSTGYSGHPFILNGDLYAGFERDTYGLTDLLRCDANNTLTVIPAPAGYDSVGYRGIPILYNGNAYLQYFGNDSNVDLVKFDGNTLTPIPSPPGYDAAGSHGYQGNPIEFDGNLYLQYRTNNRSYALFKYDGTTLTEIPTPIGYDSTDRGYQGHPIVYNDKLYLRYLSNVGRSGTLFSYDGTTLTEIPSPAGYTTRGYQGNPIIYNCELFLDYNIDNGNGTLLSYDGSNFTVYPTPAGFTAAPYGYDGRATVVYKGNLYAKYGAQNGITSLLLFDGSSFTEVPNPSGYSVSNSGYANFGFLYNDLLYLRYYSPTYNYELALLDTTGITHYPNVNCASSLIIDSLSITADTCGLGDGTIMVVASGGTTPYEYSIDAGANWQANGHFTSLYASSYTVIVRDAVSDTLSATTNVTGNNPVSVPSIIQTDTILSVSNSLSSYQWYQNGVAVGQNTNELIVSVDDDYWVMVTDANGCSGISDTISVSGISQLLSPASPSNLLATIIQKQATSPIVMLTWQDNSTNEISFQLERSEDNNSWAPIATINSNVTEYQDASVSNATTYYYRIASRNNSGLSPYSNVATITTGVTGINSIHKTSQLLVYPNPTSGKLTIKLNSINTMRSASFEVFNLLGDKIQHTELDQLETIINWDIPEGVYIYHFLIEGEIVATNRLMVVK